MMSLGLLIHDALLGGALIVTLGMAAAALVKRSRGLLVATAGIGTALFAATQPMPIEAPATVKTATAYALIAAGWAIAYVAVVQEPAALARRLGLTDRRVEWEFDVALWHVVRDYNRLLGVGRDTRPTGDDFHRLRAEVEALVRELRDLRAPTPEWQEVAAAYIRLMEVHLEAFGEPFDEARRREFDEVLASATAEREHLRQVYRERPERSL